MAPFPLQNLIYGAVMSSAVNCADVEAMCTWLKRRLPVKVGRVQVAAEVEDVAASLGETPLECLLAEDLRRIAQTIELMTIPADFEQLQENLKTVHKTAREALEQVGLKVPETRVFFVDDFPGPYKDGGFWAMSLDKKDADDYGINAGIYLKNRHLCPGVTEFLLCHELGHAAFSLLPSAELVRGLEEGLCDLLGLYACSYDRSWDLATNVLLNIRLFPEATIDKVYFDHLRQASALCNHFGFAGILELSRKVQKESRRILYLVEDEMISANVNLSSVQAILRVDNIQPFQSSKWADMERFCFRILSHPDSYVLSPEAVYLGRQLRVGENVRTSAKELGLSPMLFRSALKELTDEFYLVILEKDIVLSNEAPRYLTGLAFRYKFKAIR